MAACQCSGGSGCDCVKGPGVTGARQPSQLRAAEDGGRGDCLTGRWPADSPPHHSRWAAGNSPASSPTSPGHNQLRPVLETADKSCRNFSTAIYLTISCLFAKQQEARYIHFRVILSFVFVLIPKHFHEVIANVVFSFILITTWQRTICNRKQCLSLYSIFVIIHFIYYLQCVRALSLFSQFDLG